MQPYTSEEKRELKSSNLVVLDTVLQRDWLKNRKGFARLALKSALLFSKVYLTDVQFIDHREMWGLYREPDFQKLLVSDFDGKPAVLVGFREKCETPIEAGDNMIQSKMIFSSLYDRSELQSMINSGKVKNTKELFNKIDPTERLYKSLEYISENFKERNRLWQAEFLPGKYYSMVRSCVEMFCELKGNEIPRDMQRLAFKFKKHLRRVPKPDYYSRSTAERELWKMVHGSEPSGVPMNPAGSTEYDFEKLVLDFSYNHNISFTNPKGIMWNGNPYESILVKNFHGLLKARGLVVEEKQERQVSPNAMEILSNFLDFMDFGFIYELRSIYRKEFKKGIDKISGASSEEERQKETIKHMRFIFDTFANLPRCKEKFRQEYNERLWDAFELFAGPKMKIETGLSLGGLALYLLLKANLPAPFPYLLEYFAGLGALLSGGLAVTGLAAHSLKDRLRYSPTFRIYKAVFSENLIREVWSSND
jgi:hypothetical protein